MVKFSLYLNRCVFVMFNNVILVESTFMNIVAHRLDALVRHVQRLIATNFSPAMSATSRRAIVSYTAKEIAHCVGDLEQINFHVLWDHWARCEIFENGVLLMYMLESESSIAKFITAYEESQ